MLLLTYLLVTMLRYAVIVHPMKSRSWCSIGRTKKIICGIWAASLLLSAPLLHVMVSVARLIGTRPLLR